VFGKNSKLIVDASLPWQAKVTIFPLIWFCDEDGIIDATPDEIAKQTGIPIEHIEAGIKLLEQGDPSRPPADGGPRIVRLAENFWRLIDHENY